MNIYLISLLFCLFFLLFVIELIRRRRMAERYSLLWVVIGLVMLTLSIFPASLDALANALHVVYPPSLLFFLGYLFAVVIILHLTTVISRLHGQLTRLAQEFALLSSEQGERETSRTGSK